MSQPNAPKPDAPRGDTDGMTGAIAPDGPGSGDEPRRGDREPASVDRAPQAIFPAAPEPAAVLRPLRTDLTVSAIMDRLERRSRAGKLAGFRRVAPGACAVDLFGAPFDGLMLISAINAEAPDNPGSGPDAAPTEPTAGPTDIRFQARMKPLTPVIVWVALILSVWPGVIVVDSMIRTYWLGYPSGWWVTYAWYVPLTLLAFPVVGAQMKASRRKQLESATGIRDELKKVLGAREFEGQGAG